MVSGAFSDLAVHHHPAVQITLGAQGPLAITRDGDAHGVCRLVVIASGARHAVRSDSGSGGSTRSATTPWHMRTNCGPVEFRWR
jgi:hypothetical protein